MSFQGTTFYCAMYEEFALYSKKQENETLPDTVSLGTWYIRYAIWSNSLLLRNVWEVCTLDNRKRNRNLTQSQSRNDKSDMPPHVTFSCFLMYEVRSKQQEHEQVPDTVSFWKWYVRYDFSNVNALLVHNVWEVCTVNNRKMNKYLTQDQ